MIQSQIGGTSSSHVGRGIIKENNSYLMGKYLSDLAMLMSCQAAMLVVCIDQLFIIAPQDG